MRALILLSMHENTHSIEEEEKLKYLKYLLEQMGIPINNFWIDENSLSVDQRIKLINLLATYNIHVIDDLDGNMSVYVEKELVGEWFKPLYKLKKDLSQTDRKKQFYVEMEISFTSVFDEKQIK